MKKKIFALIAMLLLLSSFSSVFALTTIHEDVITEQLSSGAILKKYDRLTDKGWLSINIIEVDLKDGNTKVGLLNSENGLNTFQTVFQMANKDNIIAAINGDFFNGTYKNGNTIGLSISDGNLLTSTYYENEVKDTFGTFILTEDGDAWFDFFTNRIILKEKRGDAELVLSEYNKVSSNYEYPVVYTKDWEEKSIGSSPELVLTEVLVKDNKIKEIRYNGEPFEIPEDGFVISTLGQAAEYLQENFEKGTRVELEIEMDLDIDKVKMAVSGGALLVEDGEIPETFSSNITGSNPRTAIGLSKDGETLFLITVDGRQKNSIGMTQTELAELLIEKGVYNALNLDGGGSTTMVARLLGEESVKTINSPSGGILRMVTNAIGVYNTEKSGKLNSLIIKVPEENVFVNCDMNIEVLGYDKYYNPVEIELDDIEWSYTGVPIELEDGKIKAGSEAGTTTIKAKKGKVTATVSVDVLSAPNEITISPKKSAIMLGETVDLSIVAKNKNGYYASIKDEEVSWDVVSGEGFFDGSVYTAEKEGDHIISVSAGNATAYALITVGETKENIIENFEEENFEFVSYPSVVEGSVEISTEEILNGKSSAKLKYDFTTSEVTRAAYLRFNEKIEIPENAEEIIFNVYSEEEKEDYIKMKIIDAKGVVQLVMASKKIPGGEWSKISYELTNIALPAKLTDIYVGQDKPEIKNAGEIYFDKLTFVTENGVEVSETILPQDVKGEDLLNKSTELTRENSLKIAIYDENKKPQTLLDQLTKNKLLKKIESEADTVIYTSDEINGYEKLTYENATLIKLDISNGGIRVTDYNQWLNMQDDIKEADTKNVFILMNGSLDSFTDEKEKKLFIDVLCELKRETQKNIWVMYTGEETTYKMERGVKHLVIGNNWIDKNSPIDVAKNTKYMMVTVSDDEISYEIKNVFEK